MVFYLKKMWSTNTFSTHWHLGRCHYFCTESILEKVCLFCCFRGIQAKNFSRSIEFETATKCSNENVSFKAMKTNKTQIKASTFLSSMKKAFFFILRWITLLLLTTILNLANIKFLHCRFIANLHKLIIFDLIWFVYF